RPRSRRFFSDGEPARPAIAGQASACTRPAPNITKPPAQRKSFTSAFTLVELLVAVAIIAVGMVFILAGFSQCMASLSTARKMSVASFLLNKKIWEKAEFDWQTNGTEEGQWSGEFDEPYQDYSWVDVVGPVVADFGNETEVVNNLLLEETLTVLWSQTNRAKNLSIIRYVKKKQQP
ncbi:MAG: prepilin-type N-terminal cleavage/methylation domain-containing protein, partial [Candidatus Omnitrophota bacterium]